MPPSVIRTQPDSNDVNVTARYVEFHFDEVVSERPTGASGLQGLFVISPVTSAPRVQWHRDRISVRPRDGWETNTTYSVTLLPGLADLQSNVLRRERSVVFSTGPSLDNASISGIVFDWVAARTLPQARVEARVLPESPARDTLRYLAVADSAGRFTLSHLKPGSYEIRGFLDGNSNWALDPRERFDTAMVTLSDSARVELLAFVHDSLPPFVDDVSPRDSFTLHVRFSLPLDPDQSLDTTLFSIVSAADSSPVPIALVRPMLPSDRDSPAARSRADSIAREDSLRRAALPDSLRLIQAVVPSRPSPPQALLIQVDVPLAAGARYILRAGEVRGLLGFSKPSQRVFTMPERPAPARVDTASVPRSAFRSQPRAPHGVDPLRRR